MAKGKWTYHKTYNAGCCGGPGCLLMVLTLPLLPIIGGCAMIHDKCNQSTSSDNLVAQEGSNEAASNDENQ